MTRYAIYWTPARDHPLWRAGCDWLGRDAERPDAPVAWHASRDAPRRYGFHATLKAPMSLRDGQVEADLLAAVHALASDIAPFPMPALEVRMLQDFIALQTVVPVVAGDALQALADRCVTALDGFRDAAMADDMVRRAAGATGRRHELLLAYGYAFVFEQWRFHMTLSDSLPADAQGVALREDLMAAASEHFAAALAVPMFATEIAVFVEVEADGPFVLAHRIPLRGVAQPGGKA